VKGLDQFPKEDRPPVLITHIAFQVMVGAGFLMALAALLFLLFTWRWQQLLARKWWLYFTAFLTPVGFIAVEAGWTVTEVGRQPWIIYNVMRTKDAVSTMPGLQYSFYAITVVYISLSLIIIWLMRRQIKTIGQFYPSAKTE